MEQESTLLISLLALQAYQKKMTEWFKQVQDHALVLDEEKASILFPLLLSGCFDDELLTEALGISVALIQNIRELFSN